MRTATEVLGGSHDALDVAVAPPGTCTCEALEGVASEPVLPAAQRRWAARSLPERLQVVRAARHWMAARSDAFADAISPALQRSRADTLVAELLPLLDALRFLERRARSVLAPRRLGLRGRPLWLGGVRAEVHRDPFGHVLIIGPANFPLLLTGVQAAQALVAGNAVTWKPGTGGRHVALLVAQALRESGLPRGVLFIADEGTEAAEKALAAAPDKVVFTGSFDTGQRIGRSLAERGTPVVMELSGADAVVVLPSADLPLAAQAIAFGLRLNGAQVCMSPRRLIATAETMHALRPLLDAELTKIAPVRLSARTASALRGLLDDAVARGARLAGTLESEAQRPLLIEDARPEMRVTASDLFAPVLSLIEARSLLHMADLVNACSYALTAAIFGDAREARTLGEQLRVGTVLVNDLIVPTVDPRVPFGGRGRSGFGATRGAEGLLEMTAAKTVLVRRKGRTRFYQTLGERDLPLFSALIGVLHGGSLRERWSACRQLLSAGRGR